MMADAVSLVRASASWERRKWAILWTIMRDEHGQRIPWEWF